MDHVYVTRTEPLLVFSQQIFGQDIPLPPPTPSISLSSHHSHFVLPEREMEHSNSLGSIWNPGVAHTPLFLYSISNNDQDHRDQNSVYVSQEFGTLVKNSS